MAGQVNGARNKTPLGSQKPKGVAAAVRRTMVKLRRIFGSDIPENAAEAREAVAHFLSAMSAVAARTYPAWSRILIDGLSEHALTYDERRALFEINPIDDYYFAGVVALDAARIRGLYPHADAAAGRQDRVVSDLVFLLIGRIDLGSGLDLQKTPYDTVVKTLLQQISVDKIEATQSLMRDKGFRHLLGEPLAVGVPHWWRDFRTKFTLYWDEPEEMDEEETEMALQNLALASAAPAPARRRPRRRAASF